jgi:hypothetical protein
MFNVEYQSKSTSTLDIQYSTLDIKIEIHFGILNVECSMLNIEVKALQHWILK